MLYLKKNGMNQWQILMDVKIIFWKSNQGLVSKSNIGAVASLHFLFKIFDLGSCRRNPKCKYTRRFWCDFLCIKSWSKLHLTPNFVFHTGQKQNGRQFPDNIFKCIFLKEKQQHKFRLRFHLISKVSINDIPACTCHATSHYLNIWTNGG